MSTSPDEHPDVTLVVRACSDIAAELCGQQRPPGLSVAVVEPGGVWSKGFGLADIEAPKTADADSVYLWFSMTKLVTATAVLQLADRGQLELDTLVVELVPEFPKRDGGHQVTSRHLLSHSAGLANPVPVGWVRPAEAPAEDLDAFTARLLNKHSRLRGEPGSRASYSNLGYLVLGKVIQAASGAPYVEYVREQILAPLGMITTDFVYRADMTPRAATGYHRRFNISTPFLRLLTQPGIFDHRVGKFWALSRFCVQGAPYGGLIGTVSDAARFLDLHLNPGAHLDILSEQAVREMQKPAARGRKLDVGLGWFRRHSDPPGHGHYWEHLGGGGGFFNTMRLHSELNLGLVAMGNATNWDHLKLMNAAIQAVG